MNNPRTIRKRSLKFTVTTVVTVSILALIGCSSGQPSTATTEVGGTLTLSTTPEQDRGLQHFYDSFAKENGVTVDESHMEVNALNEQLRLQITARTAPDIFRSAPGNSVPSAVLSLAGEENLLDLSNEKWAKNVPDSFEPLMKSDDGMFAYPVAGQAILMFYNKAVFEEIGAEEPTTWTQFIDLCKDLKAAGKIPVSVGLGTPAFIQFIPYQLASTLVANLEPSFAKQHAAGETTFSDSKGWHQAFEMFFGLIKDGYTTENPLGTSSDQSIQAVANGDAGMLALTSGNAPVLGDYTANGMDDIGMFALPATDDAEETWVPFSPDYLVVNANAKNPAAAKAFLEYLSTPERAAEYAKATATVPALTNASPVDNPLNALVQPYLVDNRTSPFLNHLWPNGEVQQVLLQTGQQVVEGSRSIDDLLAEMDTAYAKGNS